MDLVLLSAVHSFSNSIVWAQHKHQAGHGVGVVHTSKQHTDNWADPLPGCRWRLLSAPGGGYRTPALHSGAEDLSVAPPSMSGNPPGAGCCGPEQHSAVGYGLENQVQEEDNDSPNEDIDVQRGSEGWQGERMHLCTCVVKAQALLRFQRHHIGCIDTLWGTPACAQFQLCIESLLNHHHHCLLWHLSSQRLSPRQFLRPLWPLGIAANNKWAAVNEVANTVFLFLFNTTIKYLYKGFYLQNPSFLNQEENLVTV